MTKITVSLPDDLAKAAKDAGLLSERAVEQLLRRALRERNASADLGAIFAKIDAQAEQPLTEQEITEEIAAARAERARGR
jgi:hypothetical protein